MSWLPIFLALCAITAVIFGVAERIRTNHRIRRERLDWERQQWLAELRRSNRPFMGGVITGAGTGDKPKRSPTPVAPWPRPVTDDAPPSRSAG